MNHSKKPLNYFHLKKVFWSITHSQILSIIDTMAKCHDLRHWSLANLFHLMCLVNRATQLGFETEKLKELFFSSWAFIIEPMYTYFRSVENKESLKPILFIFTWNHVLDLVKGFSYQITYIFNYWEKCIL